RYLQFRGRIRLERQWRWPKHGIRRRSQCRRRREPERDRRLLDCAVRSFGIVRAAQVRTRTIFSDKLQAFTIGPRGLEATMRSFSVQSIAWTFVFATLSGGFLLAQQPAQGQRAAGGTGGARASTAPAAFKVEWVQPQGQTGQVPIVQGNVTDLSVEVHWYGEAAKKLLTSGTPGSETTPFSAWSGECDGPFAITFKPKNNMLDMSGLGKIRWMVKTSGFHAVRPVV